MEFFSSPKLMLWITRIFPIALGATAGFAYYYFVGCVSGSCPITSNPYISTAYGALAGAAFIPKKKKPTDAATM